MRLAPIADELARIEEGLDVACEILSRFLARGFSVDRKSDGDPVTEADLAVDRALRDLLLEPGTGWLSEETADDEGRLSCERVWVVDPLDGTKEFVTGIPEFSVSIGLVENGEAIAGGVANPVTGQRVVGAIGEGVRLNGKPAAATRRASLDAAVVLASRSEVTRGEWRRFDGATFEVRPTGSVAYKLALVAAGLADATWTLVPKSEWDVAAGVALVRSSGGDVWLPDGSSPSFNRTRPLLPGLIASGGSLAPVIRALLANGKGGR